MTERELMEKLAVLGDITEEQRNSIVCSLVGHSKIVTVCWGYVSCARCGAQLGDTLAGVYNTSDAVVVGHMEGKCPVCHANYERLDWQDKLFCPDPFKLEV